MDEKKKFCFVYCNFMEKIILFFSFAYNNYEKRVMIDKVVFACFIKI